MEAMERAQARLAARLPQSILDPVVVHDLNDIKRLLIELDPANNKVFKDVEVKTKLVDQTDKGVVVHDLSAPTKSRSKRELLLAGLTIIKNRAEAAVKAGQTTDETEVNGVVMKPVKIGVEVGSFIWVDPLIRQWLGAYRDGTDICWDLDGYKYKYSIFDHQLVRVAL